MKAKLKGTLKLPIKAALFDAAGYAKTLPAPHAKIEAQKPETRSKLFEPEFAPAPKRYKDLRGHLVERGTFHDASALKLAGGTMNRPDKSEQRNNLTFNWS